MSVVMNSVVAMILGKRARERREYEYRSLSRPTGRPLPPLPQPIPVIRLIEITVKVLNEAAGKEEWSWDWRDTLGVTVTHEPTDVSLRVLDKDETHRSYSEDISEDDIARSYARRWTEYARRTYLDASRIEWWFTSSASREDWLLSLRNGDIVFIPGDGEFWVKPLRAIVYNVSPYWLFLLTEKGKEISLSLPLDVDDFEMFGKEIPTFSESWVAGVYERTVDLACPICGQYEALDCMAMHAHSHLDWIRRKARAGSLAGSF